MKLTKLGYLNRSMYNKQIVLIIATATKVSVAMISNHPQRRAGAAIPKIPKTTQTAALLNGMGSMESRISITFSSTDRAIATIPAARKRIDINIKTTALFFPNCLTNQVSSSFKIRDRTRLMKNRRNTMSGNSPNARKSINTSTPQHSRPFQLKSCHQNYNQQNLCLPKFQNKKTRTIQTKSPRSPRCLRLRQATQEQKEQKEQQQPFLNNRLL